MRVVRSHRAVDQGPTAINPVWQERRIFIFRLHDHAIALEGVEILSERQGHTRPAACIGGISNGILAHLRNISNTWILYAPQFVGIVLRISDKSRLRVDLPVVDAVCRARST